MATKKAATTKTAAKRAPVAKPAAATAAPAAAASRAAVLPVEQLTDALGFVRDVALTSVGLPFVLQSRFERPSLAMPSLRMPSFELPDVDLVAVAALLDEAKLEGAVRVAALQSRIEPIATRVRDLVPV
jgi:hypothetical protein